MSNMYYGEIVAKITGHLFQNHSHIQKIEETLKFRDEDETVFTVCAEAARVFDALEDLSGECFINWSTALNYYADQILARILDGQKLFLADMISIASESMQRARV